MTAEDKTSQPGAGARDALPWWDVRRPRTLHLYIGLCWAGTPLALLYLHGLLGQHLRVVLMVAGLVWAVGHVALIYYVLSFHLIQRPLGRLLFVVAVIAASAGAYGTALLTFMPETLSMRSLEFVPTNPQLLFGAIALLSLSVTRFSPRPSAPHT